jgi:hypothetical protein
MRTWQGWRTGVHSTIPITHTSASWRVDASMTQLGKPCRKWQGCRHAPTDSRYFLPPLQVGHSHSIFSLQAAVASARITRAAAAAADALTPSCAASWTADDGGAVWCESPNHVPRRVIDTTTSPPTALKCGCMPLAVTGEAQGDSGDDAEEDGAILLSKVAELAAKGRGVRPYPDCELTAPRCRTAPPQQEL